ncbi:MAG TPA: TonB-dependent receptor [Candidatus Baltobacteraceae bacterium]|nr:TonB-dependent receptor [Candidatus Baltobacteraceae bacterium]
MGRRLLFAFLALGFIISLCTPAYAAGGLYGSLSGTVTDSTTHAPIAAAAVEAKSPTGVYSTRTDGRGYFSIVGMSVDTYTVTITESKHEPLNIPGVVVFGDQSTSIGTVAMAPVLKTIARITSRSVASAYQPTQTTDQYTVNTQQITMSTGNAASTNENQALLAVPGVTMGNGTGMQGGAPFLTIRGGAAAEVGYQYDGVPFKEPFLGSNGSFGLINSVADIQVVEGAGDSTQGGVGSGVINVIPRRGYGPGSGYFDSEIGGPNFSHQISFNYGFSTPNNRISEYFAYAGQRFAPYLGYSNSPLNQYGNYFGTTYQTNDQFTNNFYYKFGHNLTQQVQVLYTNILERGYGGATGCGGFYDQTTNPCALVYYPYDTLTQGTLQFFTGYTPQQYASLIGLTPGTPTTNQPITQPQQNFNNQTNFLKFEYDNNLSANTYLALRYYNWQDNAATDSSYYNGPWLSGFPGLVSWAQTGGRTYGLNMDIVHQISSNLTMTLNGQYNWLEPEFTSYTPQYTIFGLLGTGLTNQPNPADWLPGGYVFDHFCGTTAWTSGPKPSCLPPLPTWGINYNNTVFQNWGTGIRFQYTASSKLRFDVGVRDEGQVRHWYSQIGNLGMGAPSFGYAVNGCAAYNANPFNYAQCPKVDIVNPYDVPGQLWHNEPTVIQPRGAINYELGPNDSIRIGYGRSAVFADAQTGGTPFHMWGLDQFVKVPAKTSAAAPTLCGWNSAAFPTAVFPCSSFAQQLYWMGDNIEAPDAENLPPAIYTNYDFSYNHQFKNGWGVRLTPFFKLGTGLPTYYLLNPVLGIFAISTQGYNKTSGVELGVTTPQKTFGLSGFMAATYQNVLSSTPPFTSGETSVPLNNLATLALGDLYRAGYVSPLSVRLGLQENLKDGITIIPDLQFDIGFPYSVGNLIAGCVILNTNGTCKQYANVEQMDMGAGISSGQASLVGGSPASSISTNYYDPAYPGTVSNPNVAWTRGTPATAANGGVLSHANLFADLTLEYKFQKNVVGVQMFNLFGSAWMNSVPAPNPWYQPVATGISGPQTGYNSCVNQTGPNVRGCYPYVPRDSYAFSNGAYLLTNGNFTGATLYGPIQPFTIQVFFQRSL